MLVLNEMQLNLVNVASFDTHLFTLTGAFKLEDNLPGQLLLR